ncbi:hypothetical protein AAFC00_003667 [Neodothiora populina]|uniref:Actin interacting protein 3 C-terminal domain-containing protein n=1 Tax=Neodothiora populina TaxID=2781224 RepID=A0ABR3PG60_9PEZI
MSSEDATLKSSTGSGSGSASASASVRSSGRQSRQQQSAPQQLSTIEKSVTHLLVATKQLLETLTHWSRGTASEAEVSDVYVRLGYEFNIACRAFNSIGVDTNDLGPVPDLLRSILEETLSQEASQPSLDRFLPRIRDIIINLLHGLKKKQQRLRQRANSGTAQTSRQASTASNVSLDSAILGNDDSNSSARPSSGRSYAARGGSGDLNGPDLPPRSTSVQGNRSSPRREGFSPSNSMHRTRDSHRDTYASDTSSMSSNAMQSIPVIAPYPQEDTMPGQPLSSSPPSSSHDSVQAPTNSTTAAPLPMPSEPPHKYYSEESLPPPPPPPKQQDALAALQRGGELERRASRRFSAYQISKHLGSSNGVPVIPPAQNSPVPNRGRDTRESMNAVRTRSIYQHGRQKSNRINTTDSPRREGGPADRRISEEPGDGRMAPPPAELGSPMAKTPDDKLGAYPFPTTEAKSQDDMGATVNGPIDIPTIEESPEPRQTNGIQRHKSTSSRDSSKRQTIQQSTSQPQFVPEGSPQPGKELTLFLQYKSKIKKFVLPDGGDLSIPRLQLAFIEKFAWNTHSNGNDLPEIYLQDPVSGVRHELEDLSDIKDRSVLVLNIEQLDEVKRHFDDGLGGIRHLIEDLRTSVIDQQTALQRVSDKQQESAKEIASIAAAPRATAGSGPRTSGSIKSASAVESQLSEVQSLRRDLAVVKQTYKSFVDDINTSMSHIRTKAASVKSVAEQASLPSMSVDAGRAYVNSGKEGLENESQKLVDRVDDLQDIVEDLRKDVVTRGVRPVPHQLDAVSSDIASANKALRKMQEYLKREKPVWSKIWEKELQVVCDDRELLTMQEELCMDLEDDLAKAAATYALVEEATRQQNAQNPSNNKGGVAGTRVLSRTLMPIALDQGADPHKAKDGVLGEVRALQPNHESRLEAIERAERARKRELESRQGGEFQKELGSFVEEGRLKKTGGVDEIERQRKLKDERIQKEVWERQQARERERAAKAAAKAQEEAAAKTTAAAAAAAAEAEQNGVEGAAEESSAPAEAVAEDSAEPASTVEPTQEAEATTAAIPTIEEPTPETDVSVSDGNEAQPATEEAATTAPEPSEPSDEAKTESTAVTSHEKAEAQAANHHDSKLDVLVPTGTLSVEDIVGSGGVPSPEMEFSDAKEMPPTPSAE